MCSTRRFDEDLTPLSMFSCLSGRDVWLLDCMNIRGACNFPELSLFCEAIRRWAASLETARRLPPLVVLAIDHGLRQEAFALSATLAVAFSGDADADTLIVSAVDALLSADPHELRVVTSDHLLRQRCRRELPLDASEAYLGGVQRPLEQLVTLAFESSETFARTLTLTPAAVPSADSVFSAYGGEAPEAPEGGSGAAVEAPMPLTKRARRKAQRRAETQCARARCYSETTAERVRAAESLHRLVAARRACKCSALRPPLPPGARRGVAPQTCGGASRSVLDFGRRDGLGLVLRPPIGGRRRDVDALVPRRCRAPPPPQAARKGRQLPCLVGRAARASAQSRRRAR